MPIAFDITHAPELLVIRFNQWPTIEQLPTIRERIAPMSIRPYTAVFVDLRALSGVPPETQIGMLMGAWFARSGCFPRQAYVIASPEHELIVAEMQSYVRDANWIRPFRDSASAFDWLIFDG